MGFVFLIIMIEYYKNLSLENLFYTDENGVLQEEEWGDIPNFEKLYQGSSFGRAKGVDRYVFNKRGFYSLIKGRILKQGIDNGYCRVGLHKNGKATKKYIHIAVAEIFIPNPENKPEVNHLKKMPCGTKMNTLDNRVGSLVWATRAENMQYGYDFGFKCAKGENNGQSKLTTEQVLEIRATGKYKNYTKEMAIKYGVAEKYISDIMNRKRWKHI